MGREPEIMLCPSGQKEMGLEEGTAQRDIQTHLEGHSQLRISFVKGAEL